MCQLWMLPFFAFAITPAAMAGEAEISEHSRLRAERDAWVARGAWGGVERAFLAMEALESKGEPLSYDDLYVGAQSASALGDVDAVRDRLSRALEREANAEAALWLREIDRRFAPVRLSAPDPAARALVAEAPPIEPWARAAITRAAAALAATGEYTGWLPPGAYALGPARFEVRAGPAPVVVDARLASARAESMPALSARLSAGPAFTGALTRAEADLQRPPGLSAPGLHAALGADLWLATHLGLGAEVAAHTLLEDADNGLSLVGLGLSATGRAGRWTGHLGPTAGVGALRAVGLDDPAAVDSRCPYGTTDAGCDWISAVPLDDRDAYLWSGTVALWGAQGAVAVDVIELGPRARAGLALSGGAWVDPWHVWPWAQLGVEIKSDLD